VAAVSVWNWEQVHHTHGREWQGVGGYYRQRRSESLACFPKGVGRRLSPPYSDNSLGLENPKVVGDMYRIRVALRQVRRLMA